MRTIFASAAVAVATATLLAPAVASAGFDGSSRALYSYEGGTNCKKQLDPMNVVAFSSREDIKAFDVAVLVGTHTAKYGSTRSGYKRWMRDAPLSTGNQQFWDHGECQTAQNNNATAIRPAADRYHIRWRQSAGRLGLSPTPRAENGPKYVMGTAHYDKRCEGKHDVLTFNGARKVLADAMRPYISRVSYVDYGTLKPRMFPCFVRQGIGDGSGIVGGDGGVAFFNMVAKP